LHLAIVLPVGVSFYSFKGISYVVDNYRGQLRAEHSYTDFALFMAFFPSILAGPIDRASAFLQQICEKRNLNWDQSIRGLHLFLYGLFKKVVIADGVVRTVSSVFDSTAQASWIDVVVATLLFTIQIYCDFSGYTDMARGTAKFFGIDLMVNFRLPYFSKNPREFWNRWHISLSTWLRDYLYIPLGGNRKGNVKTYRNLIITMVLGGLWHGAAWNFVFWGLYHGILLSVHRAVDSIRSAQARKSMFTDLVKIALCFIAICYGWLFFRAPSLDKIVSLTSTLIFDFGNMDLGVAWPKMAAVLGLPIFFMLEFIERAGGEKAFYKALPVPIWTALYAVIIFCLAIGLTTESTQFIYMVF
jgi:D-alanyl-lipoteichoic acid acyltransferase DltB (MBOAT superfamily)